MKLTLDEEGGGEKGQNYFNTMCLLYKVGK